VPSGRHRDEFRYALAPRVPSFNESHVDNKPSWVRQIDYLTDAQIANADRLQQKRLRSLRSVEDMIAAVLQALNETGRLGTTYVLFTSDNGLLMGQHRAVALKGNAYEEAIAVPFLVRGPGVPVGRADQLVLNLYRGADTALIESLNHRIETLLACRGASSRN
jgi:arylsulfatase A-like enzyme